MLKIGEPIDLNLVPNQLHSLGGSLKELAKNSRDITIQDNQKGDNNPSLMFEDKLYSKIILRANQKNIEIKKGVLYLPLSMLDSVMLDPVTNSGVYNKEITVKTTYATPGIKPGLDCFPKTIITDVNLTIDKDAVKKKEAGEKQALNWQRGPNLALLGSSMLDLKLTSLTAPTHCFHKILTAKKDI